MRLHGCKAMLASGYKLEVIGNVCPHCFEDLEKEDLKSELRQTKERLARAVLVIQSSYAYLSSFKCETTCDPAVNVHIPECCIAKDMRDFLAEMEGK